MNRNQNRPRLLVFRQVVLAIVTAASLAAVPTSRPSIATPIAMAGHGMYDDSSNGHRSIDMAPIAGEKNSSAGIQLVQPNSTTAVTITDLTPDGGGSVSSINEPGEVAGTKFSPRHGFLWRNGKVTDLGALDGNASEASAINDLGQVVGRFTFDVSDFPYLHSHAFLWQNGAMTDLGTLGGEESTAYDINVLGRPWVAPIPL